MDTVCKAIRSIKKVKRSIIHSMINMYGWNTGRKLLIIESDDWGSIRMPSREVYEKLLRSGDKVDSDPFTRYDSIECEDDLTLLFDTLTKYKDYKGNYPVITANYAVANPDFDRIEESGYREFYYEPFTKTLGKYPEHRRSFEICRQGIVQKVFFPQLHCREHMNITRWLRHLQEGKRDVVTAFKNRMISTGDSFCPANRYAYMDSFNYGSQEELDVVLTAIKEGAELFRNIFGYGTKSFIASCYIWDSELEKEVKNAGIEYIQGSSVQYVPGSDEGTKTLGRKIHYIGQVNKYSQVYLMRNCCFEPSWNKNADWVSNCLWDISMAFKWNKPATISTHRLNYIGYIDEDNRNRNLKLLSDLLSEITKTWSDVEFITSAELGYMIKADKTNTNKI